MISSGGAISNSLIEIFMNSTKMQSLWYIKVFRRT